MPSTIRPEMISALSTTPPPGSVEIAEWTLGIDFKMEVYVLNLYSGGINYPEIVSKDAVAGIVQSLGLAKQCGGKVYYIPSNTVSILYIGRIHT